MVKGMIIFSWILVAHKLVYRTLIIKEFLRLNYKMKVKLFYVIDALTVDP